MAYNARYWREQAVLCLEISRQISDRVAAEDMRAKAALYFARAAELEKRETEAEQSDEGTP